MSDAITGVLGTSIGGGLAIVWLFGLLLYGALPVMALIITLNIRRMRIALERLSNTAEATPGWTRTGPLNLSGVNGR